MTSNKTNRTLRTLDQQPCSPPNIGPGRGGGGTNLLLPSPLPRRIGRASVSFGYGGLLPFDFWRPDLAANRPLWRIPSDRTNYQMWQRGGAAGSQLQPAPVCVENP